MSTEPAVTATPIIADDPALPPLVTGPYLIAYKGAPFADDIVEDAGGQVRGETGWHIAPVAINHRVQVSGTGTTRLLLPTLRIRDVALIWDLENDRALTDWRPLGGGRLYRSATLGGWPRGEDNLAVTMSHGFDETPRELVGVVAERARVLSNPPPPGQRSHQKIVGSRSTYDMYADNIPGWSTAAAGILERYRV